MKTCSNLQPSETWKWNLHGTPSLLQSEWPPGRNMAANAGEDGGEDPSTLLVGMEININSSENQTERILLLDTYTKEPESSCTHAGKHIAVSSTKAGHWHQPTSPPEEE